MYKSYEKILNSKESQAKDTVWYSLGTICGSAASMIILLIVTRILGQEMSGIFSLAWSAAQLMLTIGWFSTRQYQVSDVDEKIGYYEYRFAKVISSTIMVMGGLLYVHIYDYDERAKLITALLCVLFIADVFADFFCGFFQCNGKLHIGGKSYVIRNISYIVIFSVTLLLWNNLVFSIIAAIIVEFVWLLLFDYQLAKIIPKKNTSFEIKNVIILFVECSPLFLGSFITSFITNVPKNAINLYLDYDIQASYNILFMPTAVINMFNMFICVPFYGRLATMWQSNKRKAFWEILYKIIGIVSLITLAFLICGSTLGIPVLSWLYNVNLQPYLKSFVMLILGGGFNGIISILTYVITVFRKQHVIIYVYLLCAILTQSLSGIMVRNLGMMGAAITYTVTLGCVCVGLMLCIAIYLKKANKNVVKEGKE